jgi:hypothetical protein
MAKHEMPDISRLSGSEVEKVATALVAGHLDAILNRRDEIVKLKTDELQRLVDIAGATRSNCGGFGCG